MPEIVWTRGAEGDVDELFVYFEEIADGKGEKFLAALQQSVSLLKRFPELGSPYTRPFRRLLSYNRTVGIYYVVEARGIVIQVVFRLKDSPAALERRIRQITRRWRSN